MPSVSFRCTNVVIPDGCYTPRGPTIQRDGGHKTLRYVRRFCSRFLLDQMECGLSSVEWAADRAVPENVLFQR
ncbi:hypothetical protein BH09CHL1_BH09CHL1_00700 [soil metagenome]